MNPITFSPVQPIIVKEKVCFAVNVSLNNVVKFIFYYQQMAWNKWAWCLADYALESLVAEDIAPTISEAFNEAVQTIKQRACPHAIQPREPQKRCFFPWCGIDGHFCVECGQSGRSDG